MLLLQTYIYIYIYIYICVCVCVCVLGWVPGKQNLPSKHYRKDVTRHQLILCLVYIFQAISVVTVFGNYFYLTANYISKQRDRLCGLSVTFLAVDTDVLGSIPGVTKFSA
jgi:hypothetical protein